jgi:hypothetical protein
MKRTRFFAELVLIALGLVTAVPAQGVGSKVPALELEDFAQTPAKSYEDFLGRAVLIEFFAYW